MKYFLVSFFLVVFLGACDSDVSDSPDIGRHDQASTNPDQADQRAIPGGASVSSLPEGSDFNIPNRKPPLKFAEMESLMDLRRMCDFKKDHIVSKDDQLVAFNRRLILKGSKEPLPVREIIKDKEHETWSTEWFGDWHSDVKIVNNSRNRVTLYDGKLFVPYEYDKEEEYGDWCSEEEECIVWVIYKGAIQSILAEADDLQPEVVQSNLSPQEKDGSNSFPSIAAQAAGSSPSQNGTLNLPTVREPTEKPPALPLKSLHANIETSSFPGAKPPSSPSSSNSPDRYPRRGPSQPSFILGDWRFTGDLVVQIQFSGKVLDFSICDNVH